MGLSTEDANAIVGLANRLGVDPGSLAGLMEMESGIDANIWGGASGKYRGLIQFGPGARSEVGLPDGEMTIAQQVPYVEKYFNQRGFKPGMSTEQLYRTVLVGNPHQSGTDSFGTNSDSAGARMKPGGDLYQRGLAKLQGATLKGNTTGTGSGALNNSPGGGIDMGPLPTSTGHAGQDAALAALSVGPGGGTQRMAGGLGEAIFGASTAKPVTRMAGGQGATQAPSGQSQPIEYLTGDKDHGGYRHDHGGSNYHEHLAFATTEQRNAAISKLQGHGIEIGSVNDGKHAPGSYHYQDLAFDVPAHQVPVGQEQALSRRVRSILGMQ